MRAIISVSDKTGVRSKMRKRLWIALSLLVAMTLLVVGCDSKVIKPLTNNEMNSMIETALAHPEVSKWMGETSVYKIEVGWAAVGWSESEATGWARLEYEEIADGNLPTDRVFPSERVTINPDVYIRDGVPTRLHIHASFDRETGEVVAVQLMPGR